MKYCVVKGTVTVIDGSENSDEIMIQNAKNAGFEVSEIEILSESDFKIRKDLIPAISPEPSDGERISALEAALLEMVLGGTQA